VTCESERRRDVLFLKLRHNSKRKEENERRERFIINNIIIIIIIIIIHHARRGIERERDRQDRLTASIII
jgi:cell division protein FtsB